MNDDTDSYENDRTRRMLPSEMPPQTGDTDKTRAVNPADATRGMPTEQMPQRPAVVPPPARIPVKQQQPPRPMQPQPGQMPPRTQPPAQYGRARARRESGLYLPLWSLVLMLVSVFACAGLIVFVVISLGGNTPSQAPPVIFISTVAPTERPSSFPASPATATIPPAVEPIGTQPPVSFALSGPTLPPVILSPTPGIIDIGVQVVVVDVGLEEMNVRDNPGVTGTSIIFRVPEGTRFTVVGGPQQADGLTWWQIASVDNASRVGWAASNYLEYRANEN